MMYIYTMQSINRSIKVYLSVNLVCSCMTALQISSPQQHLSSIMGWQMQQPEEEGEEEEDITAQDLHYEPAFACYSTSPVRETLDASSYQLHHPGFSSSPQQAEEFDQIDPHHDLLQLHDYSSILLTTTKDSSSGSGTRTRKLCHNAYERDRRKKLNDLYSSLGALLPDSDQCKKKKKKKLSIPLTIGRVLKYIPELEGLVKRLLRRKEVMLSASRPEADHHQEQEGQYCAVGSSSSSGITVEHPMVSVATCLLNDREVMVQVCYLLNNKDACRIPFSSKVIQVLEREGLHLMNASTYTTQDNRYFCSLHIQAREAFRTDCRIFCEHLMKVIKEAARLGSSINTRNMYM